MQCTELYRYVIVRIFIEEIPFDISKMLRRSKTNTNVPFYHKINVNKMTFKEQYYVLIS